MCAIIIKSHQEGLNMLWNNSLETGIPKIDEQHKELFRQADILLDRGKDDRIPQTIDFLAKYVAKHFSDEQVMHASSQYPKALAHKQLHVDFVKRFKDLKQRYEAAGHSLQSVMDINRLVMGWLKEHIMVHDKEFANYYKMKTGK
ncbi:hemerythrin [Deltaproteobacteria bacterium Smac51]|nr:hemerythrin [Deltaproteobacteria bacterium Smac51]